jgi:hypothetical protein
VAARDERIFECEFWKKIDRFGRCPHANAFPCFLARKCKPPRQMSTPSNENDFCGVGFSCVNFVIGETQLKHRFVRFFLEFVLGPQAKEVTVSLQDCGCCGEKCGLNLDASLKNNKELTPAYMRALSETR